MFIPNITIPNTIAPINTISGVNLIKDLEFSENDNNPKDELGPLEYDLFFPHFMTSPNTINTTL